MKKADSYAFRLQYEEPPKNIAETQAAVKKRLVELKKKNTLWVVVEYNQSVRMLWKFAWLIKLVPSAIFKKFHEKYVRPGKLQ